jgi:hypothetical protein
LFLHVLPQLGFELIDQLVAFGLDGVLATEELSPELAALVFEFALLFLPRQLFFQCGRNRRGAAHLLDLAIKLLDLLLDTQLQVIRPCIQLLDLQLEITQ